MTSPSCAEWACCAPTAESCLAFAPGAGAALPKSPDTGAVGSFGSPSLSIPYGLQLHTTTTTPPSSALHEIPATDWDTCYAGSAAAANGAVAMFGCSAPCLTADVAEAVPVPAAGYDMAVSQVGLDEFINAF